MNNALDVRFAAKSENEALARLIISAFLAPLDPLVEELAEFKTSLSEAVTNAIIHGYDEAENGWVYVNARIKDHTVTVEIRDEGAGIADIELAREQLYSSQAHEERSGMGFTIMESFCDEVTIHSSNGLGTTIQLIKYFTPTASFSQVN